MKAYINSKKFIFQSSSEVIEQLLELPPPKSRSVEQICFLISVLKKFDFFDNFIDMLSIEEWGILAINSLVISYNKLDQVFKRYEHSKEAYFLLRGGVAVTMTRLKTFTSKQLRESTITVLRPPSYFGEIGALYGGAR